MASKVDRVGTYRFDKVLEAGVSLTSKSQMPTFNVRLRLSEFFDEDEKVWVDWSGAEVEQVCYFTLFGKNGKTGVVGPIFNHEQIMKVFNWEGKSFQILSNDDYSQIKGQIRIEDNDPDYAAKNPFQVSWIDVFDADPVRTLKKLDDKALKDLDATFAMALQASGKAAAPAAAPGKKKTGPVAPPKPAGITKPETKAPSPEKEPEEKELTAEEKKAAIKAKSEKNKAAAKGKRPAPPTAPPAAPSRKTDPEPEEEVCGKQYTKQEAWEIVCEMTADGVTDEQRQAAWLTAIEAIAGDVDDDAVTKQQWGQIVDATLDTEYEDGKTIGKF